MSEYDQWRRLHADLFGLHSPDDLRLFTLWEQRLAAFSFAELRDASFAIAEDPSDKARFRVNHLSMLTAHIFARRADAAAREQERQERQFATADCPDCFGVGLVRVPHADFVRDAALMRGVYMAVACACAAGTARFNAVNGRLTAAESEHRLLDLPQYEATVPDWRLILTAHEEAEDRDHDAADLARRVDRAAGPIDTRDLAERMARR